MEGCSNRRLRVIIFTLILVLWSIFAFSCEVNGAGNSGSNTAKIKVSGEFIIFVGAFIAFILECLNNRGNNMDIISGAFVIIGSILYLMAMCMDINNTYNNDYQCEIAALYLLPGITALVVGIDITQKVQKVLNNTRERIILFALLLCIVSILRLIYWFNLGSDWHTQQRGWWEVGWCIIAIMTFLILVINGILQMQHKTVCIALGVILFVGAGIVLCTGSDMEYSRYGNFSCNMRNIGWYIIMFVDAMTVVLDINFVGGGRRGYRRI